MNISTIQRMVRAGDMSAGAMRYLLSCRGECEWLDHKQDIHLDNDKELCDFVRDAIGIKNVGGGYIVIGVVDKTWEPMGLETRLPYDTKMVRDKIQKAAGLFIDVDIVCHELQPTGVSKFYGLVLVRSALKRTKLRVPTLVNKDYCAKEKYGLRRGQIWARSGDSTVLVTSDRDLQDIIDRLEEQANSDAMQLSGRVSPFTVEDGTYRLLEKGFDNFVGRAALRQELLSAVTKDPRLWIINVHGPGGVGKSALVNWAVYEFYTSRKFEAILQLTAKETALTTQGIERCSRSLYSLENLLDHILVLFEETPPTALADKKRAATELLSAWTTLLVLDNMETVQDGRILSFIQELPIDNKAKILMTSRQKTGGWELPFPIQELDMQEVRDFLTMRAAELGLEFPLDDRSVEQVRQATGGLPLAIQWVLGRYKLEPSLASVIAAVGQKDSPVLEFSFRNIWQVLSDDAKSILAAMTIFEESPSTQQVAIVTEFPVERIERALAQLSEVTLVTRNIKMSDGRVTYDMLPITSSFAQHQLSTMGEYETTCRKRYQQFIDQMRLQESEIFKFQSRFLQYGIETDNEKRAAILCQRGESEMFVGNVDNADMLFRQARDTAPQSAYVYAMSASYELSRNRITNATQYADEACRRATKKTGALCFAIRARICDVQRDRGGRVTALEKAVEYNPENHVTRHQYGVALSRAGRTDDAIRQFTIIIDEEKSKVPPTFQMLMALKTRMINLKRSKRTQEFEEDLKTAKDIFQKYPHLVGEAEQFSEFLG